MRLLLATSAIIGWLERNDTTLPALVAESDTVAYHPVPLGELHAGVERAGTEAELQMRTNALRFTQGRLQAVAGRAWVRPSCRLLTSAAVESV